MALVSIDDLYNYFLSGKKPTQQQFRNLIDTLKNAATSEGIIIIPPSISVQTCFVAQGKFISAIVLDGGDGEDYNFNAGITDGGNEILSDELVSNAKGVFPVGYYCEVERTIYFGNVPNDVTIKLYIK